MAADWTVLWDNMKSQIPSILTSFTSWLHHKANESKDVHDIWVVNMKETDTIKIMHTDVYTAVLHGMAGFEDDEWRFDAIQQRLCEWCETVSSEFNSNISIHVSEWGPLVIEDIQMCCTFAVLQKLDVYVKDMGELILEYPDDIGYYWKKYKTAYKYQRQIANKLSKCASAA
jgi:hypothetical protein